MAIAIWVFIAIMVFIAFVRYALSPSKRKGPEEDKCRYGFIESEFEISELFHKDRQCHVIVRVREMGQEGNFSRIDVLSVSGIEPDMKRKVAEYFNGWIETSRVKWDTEGQGV